MGFGLLQGLGNGFTDFSKIWGEIPEQQRRRAADARAEKQLADELLTSSAARDASKASTEHTTTSTGILKSTEADRQRDVGIQNLRRIFSADRNWVVPQAERPAYLAKYGQNVLTPEGKLNEGFLYNPLEQATLTEATAKAGTAKNVYDVDVTGGGYKARSDAELAERRAGVAAHGAAARASQLAGDKTEIDMAYDRSPRGRAENELGSAYASFMRDRAAYTAMVQRMRDAKMDPRAGMAVDIGVSDAVVEAQRRQLRANAEQLAARWAILFQGHSANQGKIVDAAQLKKEQDAYADDLFPYKEKIDIEPASAVNEGPTAKAMRAWAESQKTNPGQPSGIREP